MAALATIAAVPPSSASSTFTPPLQQESPSFSAESPIQQQQQETSLPPLHEEPEELLTVEPTDVTIKTDVDPHYETTTTTTIVHLPFQLAHQCPPPKVISWMKSKNAPSTTTARSTSMPTQQPSTKQHRRHHPHQRRSQSSPTLLHHILPFLHKRRGASSSKDVVKKSDRAVTVFSIQVTVLGRVLVPPSSPTVNSSVTMTPTGVSSSSSTHSDQLQQQQEQLETELAPTKTIPAQLNRSETTSYVIHRTFEDFERLSEMVLRLEHLLNSHHHGRPHPTEHQDTSTLSASTAQSTDTLSAAPPVLTALQVHHPYPGLYQTLLKQFSNVKANQRAFDASSTTHGFDQEGAFERVLELNQYLENVWYWLLPENTPTHLDVSLEQHEIMQWLKPLAKGAHADGQQMRGRPEEDDKRQEQRSSEILKQYGSSSSMRKSAGAVAAAAAAAAASPTATVPTNNVNDGSGSPSGPGEEAVVVASKASSVTSSSTPTSGLIAEQHADHVKRGSEQEKASSASSLPSLTSSASSSPSTGSSMSLSSATSDHGDDDADIHGHAVTRPESFSASSLAPSSTVLSSAGSVHKGDAAIEKDHQRQKTGGDSLDQKDGGGGGDGAPRGGLRHQRDSTFDPLASVKVKRRISLSNVLRSLTSPLNHGNNSKDLENSTLHKRATIIGTVGRSRSRALATTTTTTTTTSKESHSMPTSPTRRHSSLQEPEEIIIWNTVTTKNSPLATKPMLASH
ncbi:hypothetical protein EDD11_009189 [Mortierella claussenii]|nr:hypothetical protein EDD11_009189 [Mortierella claussenii]